MPVVGVGYGDELSQCIRAIREDKVPCQIEEGLFLGSIGASYNKQALKSLNVTHVLIVAKSLEPAYPSDFIYKKIGVLDTAAEKIEDYFGECFDFIEQAKSAGGCVLVHCFAGRSRSVTVVVAYLMKKHGMSMSQAIDLVKSKRPQIAPNTGFLTQLENYEKSIPETKLGMDFLINQGGDSLTHVSILEPPLRGWTER